MNIAYFKRFKMEIDLYDAPPLPSLPEGYALVPWAPSLGKALLVQALHGFRRRGLGRGILEVTAQNDAAVRLYRSIGFRCRKTVYKAVDTTQALQLAGQLDA